MPLGLHHNLPLSSGDTNVESSTGEPASPVPKRPITLGDLSDYRRTVLLESSRQIAREIGTVLQNMQEDALNGKTNLHQHRETADALQDLVQSMRNDKPIDHAVLQKFGIMSGTFKISSVEALAIEHDLEVQCGKEHGVEAVLRQSSGAHATSTPVAPGLPAGMVAHMLEQSRLGFRGFDRALTRAMNQVDQFDLRRHGFEVPPFLHPIGPPRN